MKINCEHIAKTFENKHASLEVLGDITCSTREHDFVCLLGPNGCGKSTLLKIIAGVLKPSGGQVLFKDTNGSSRPVSLVFQEYGLFPWLNVMDNACFYLEMRGLPKKERYQKASVLIDHLGLSKFAGYYPYQLSLGMKQKVNLIRGLLMDSEALLIDEVDRSLDVYSRLLVHKDLYKIWKDYGKTIISVTHDIDNALIIAKTIWIMGGSPSKIVDVFDVEKIRSACSGGQGPNMLLAQLRDRIVEVIEREAQKMAIL